MNDADTGASILVIDDTPTRVGLLVETLSHAGYQVRAAPHLAPGFTLLDVTLQGVDGLETCRRLQAIPSIAQLPVIFMSATQVARAALSAALSDTDRRKGAGSVSVTLESASTASNASMNASGEVLTLEALERAHIITVLRRTHGVIEGPKGAAKLLNLKPSTARFRMKKLGIARADFSHDA